MAGAFHGVGEADCVINVGVSGPGVVRAALAKADKTLPMNELADIIKKTAFKVTSPLAQASSPGLFAPFPDFFVVQSLSRIDAFSA